MYHTNHSIHLAPELIKKFARHAVPPIPKPLKKGSLDRAGIGKAAWKGSLERQLGKGRHWKGSLERQLGKAAWKGSLERQRGKAAWKGIARHAVPPKPKPLKKGSLDSLERQYGPVLQNLRRRQEWHQTPGYGQAHNMQISM